MHIMKVQEASLNAHKHIASQYKRSGCIEPWVRMYLSATPASSPSSMSTSAAKQNALTMPSFSKVLYIYSVCNLSSATLFMCTAAREAWQRITAAGVQAAL